LGAPTAARGGPASLAEAGLDALLRERNARAPTGRGNEEAPTRPLVDDAEATIRTNLLLSACGTPEAARALWDRAARAGVRPSASTFAALIDQLMVWARRDEAAAVEREAEAALAEPRSVESGRGAGGVSASVASPPPSALASDAAAGAVRAALDPPRGRLDGLRLSALRQLTASGRTAEALSLFDALLASGEATAHQTAAAVRGACGGPEEAAALIARAEAAGVPPAAATARALAEKRRAEEGRLGVSAR
jgi:hypothetical protein